MTAAKPTVDVKSANAELNGANASKVVQWAAHTFGNQLIMTSSFGAQSVVTLHLVTQVIPNIPVILIDTGYLFADTYHYIEQLHKRLRLNLHVYQPVITAARFEAIHGRQWEKGEEGLDIYHQIHKIEPMQRAVTEIGASAWLSGLRIDQTEHRAQLQTLTLQDQIFRIQPILHWTKKDINRYIQSYDLPEHPMVHKGYESIGDTHSTQPVAAGIESSERAGRFRGLKQECGLHLPQSKAENASRNSSSL